MSASQFESVIEAIDTVEIESSQPGGHLQLQSNSELGAQEALITHAFARLDPVALGVAVGCVTGLGLFVLTAVLLVQAGAYMGMHLGRLSYFLPGYSVSWGGAVLGGLEVAVGGFLLGAVLAMLWNAHHSLFVAFVVAREHRRDMSRELQGL